MTTYRKYPVTGKHIAVTLEREHTFGPRYGWGTLLGVLVLGISLYTWINAQQIVLGLMNGGQVTEASATTALDTLRRNAAIGSATGSVFSARLAIAAIQAATLALSILSRSLIAAQRSADASASDWRPWRYASDVDPGGLSRFLEGTQHYLADIPRKTAAIIRKAAVFLWNLFSAGASSTGRHIGIAFDRVVRSLEATVSATGALVARPLLAAAIAAGVAADRLLGPPLGLAFRLAEWTGKGASFLVVLPFLAALLAGIWLHTTGTRLLRITSGPITSLVKAVAGSLKTAVFLAIFPVRLAAGGVSAATAMLSTGVGSVAACVPSMASTGLEGLNRLLMALVAVVKPLAETAPLPLVAAWMLGIATTNVLSRAAGAATRTVDDLLNAAGETISGAIGAAGKAASTALNAVSRALLLVVLVAVAPLVVIGKAISLVASTAAATAGAGLAALAVITGAGITLATAAAARTVDTPARAVADLARYLLAGANAAVTALGQTTSHACRAATAPFLYAAKTLELATQTAFRLAAEQTAQASRTAVQLALMLARAALEPVKHAWLGILGILDALKITGILLARVIHLPVRALSIIAHTTATGITALPDGARLIVLLAKSGGRKESMTIVNMPRERLLSMIAVIWAIGIGGFFLVNVVMPPAPPPTVTISHWTTGHLTRDGLLFEMAEEFNRQGRTVADGTRIRVEVFNVPSELIGKYLSQRIRFGTKRDLHRETNGYVVANPTDPTIVTPSSAHWLVSVNHEIGRDVVDLVGAEPIVRPVIGIVTYEEMARCLGWPEKELGFQDIIDLRADEKGWGRYAHCAKSEWGTQPLLAFTDPTTSSTGRSLHLALYSMAAGKTPEQLEISDVTDPGVVQYVKEFQGLIDHYQIGTTVLNTKIVEGPRWGHFFVMPEDNLIHLVEGTEQAYVNGRKVTITKDLVGKMVMIYPKEGSMPRNNCACIVDADWVSDQQVEASHQWIDFIRGDDQQRRFMAAGFRPGTDISLSDPASKITAEFGLRPDGPKKVLNPSLTQPDVAAEIDRNWEQVKRPGIVNFVIDVSGSMLSDKLDEAQKGLGLAIDSMANNNRVGMISFSDEVHEQVPILPKLLDAHGIRIADTARLLKAGGETALFDAVERAILNVDVAQGDEGAIRAVVVLTDGRANIGSAGLTDIVKIAYRGERPLPPFSGWQGETPVDENGREVPLADVIGVDLAMETVHDVQVFFIGIGDDADLEVGRILTQATGADLRGVTEEDLAQVLEEVGNYF